MTYRLTLAAVAALLAAPVPAAAQLLPDLGPVTGGLPPLPTNGLPVVGNLLGQDGQAAQLAQPTLNRLGQGGIASRLSRGDLADVREARLKRLREEYRDELDRDRDDNPVRRGQLVLVDPSDDGLARAIAAGFSPIDQRMLDGLDLRLVLVAIPEDEDDVRDAIKDLRKAVPGLTVDYDHIFEPAGGALAPVPMAAANSVNASQRGTTIAIVDGGVAAHPSMANASIRQRGFSGKAVATGHGTAVASLLVGDEGAFRGAARGTRLLVGDVYGGSPAKGSASAIAAAIAWGVNEGADVINISLVGPPNKLVEATIAKARARGVKIVAAVGNDGPAAPTPYPASYEGVIAITGVDEDGRALREAGRSKNLAFAAPGADLAAALPGQGYAEVRGTSFAAPLASARLALSGSVSALEREAVKGKGRVGRGIVCVTCRIDPDAVGAK